MTLLEGNLNRNQALSVLRQGLPNFRTSFTSACGLDLTLRQEFALDTLLLKKDVSSSRIPTKLSLVMLREDLHRDKVVEVPIASVTDRKSMKPVGVIRESTSVDAWKERNKKCIVQSVSNRTLFTFLQAVYKADKSLAHAEANMIGKAAEITGLSDENAELKRLFEAMNLANEMGWKRQDYHDVELDVALKYL